MMYQEKKNMSTSFRRSSTLIIFVFTVLFGEAVTALKCGFPGAPAHSTVEFSTPTVEPGTVARYTCDRGFELLGPARRMCGTNGTWVPQGIPFCVLNVAAGKAPMQSSVSEGGIPQKAVDGSTSTFFDDSTCTLTDVERAPWWYVNLLEPYMVQLVRIDFGQSCCAKGRDAVIVVRVGNNRPDLGVNPICNRFTGSLEEGRPLFLPCNPPMPGAFVSVHFEGPPGVSLSICETFVYTDQALPIERCPTFRDQPPGSTATYNGKCYIFYNQQPTTFQGAMDFCESRGGSLVDESNPALQGFLSWELWRRHKGDANGQYWMGAVRDQEDPKNWKWIDGKPVSVSFWNLPGGNDNCARFDGTKGWLWSDTNCGLNLNFICQHRPTTCGKPEQPPNSTLIAQKFNVGSRIEYTCDGGHLLVGPSQRSCLPTGFYSEFPPVCRYLECGMPAEVEFSEMTFVNATSSNNEIQEKQSPRGFQSFVRYDCDPGYIAVGRSKLMCDVDERWNGPPPRCEPVYCPEPPTIRHGGVSLSSNSTAFNTVLTYYCTSQRYVLVGRPKLICKADGAWDGKIPMCRPKDRKDPLDRLLDLGGRGAIDQEVASNEKSREGGGLSVNPLSGIGSRTPIISRDRPFRTQPAVPNIREKLDFPNKRGRPNRRPSFTPSVIKDIQVEQKIYENPATTLDNIDRNILLYAGGLGNAGTRGQGPRFKPMDNEIPDSANVQANPGQGADEPQPVRNAGPTNNNTSRQQQLNLGGIIALGVFGGFVFLAAIITTIVILIRRKEPRPSSAHGHLGGSGHHHGVSKIRRSTDSGTESGGSSGSSTRDYGGGGRERTDNEEARDASEMVVHSSYAKQEKERGGHHHHHHHRHKHRSGRDSNQSGEKSSPHHRRY